MTYECSKCGGAGEIQAFKGIMGGVCFKCNGSGKQSRKPATPSVLWTCVYAGVDRFQKPAKTEREAMKKAVSHWKQHSSCIAFADVKSEADISVQRWEH